MWSCSSPSIEGDGVHVRDTDKHITPLGLNILGTMIGRLPHRTLRDKSAARLCYR